MAERIKYVVVCDCAGGVEPVALIDDDRPVGGSVTVRGVGPEDTAAMFAVADGENNNVAYGQVAKSWAERSVTETIWGDGHSTWTIRCADCEQQVQLSDKKPDKHLLAIVEAVADAMVTCWETRQADPPMIVQHGRQWRTVEPEEPLSKFAGYGEVLDITTRQMMLHPLELDRWTAARVTDDRRRDWYT